jgi:membrane-associated phospholipid phosphatase
MKRLFVFCVISCSLFAKAQSSREIVDPNLWQDFTYDMGVVFGGVGHAYSRPLYWQGNDFKNLGFVAAGVGSLALLDDEIRTLANNQVDDVPQLILEYGDRSGSPQVAYSFQGAVYLTGLFTRNEKLRRTGVLLISSATATGFLQQLTKSLTGRARPRAELGSNHFRPFGGSAAFRSFPSGHSVLTFTAAHSIAKQFDNKWAKAGIYTLGLIPGLTRIYEEQHWATDVVLSWALSYFMVEAIDIYLDKKYDQKYNPQVDSTFSKLSLSLGGGGIGVAFTF